MKGEAFVPVSIIVGASSQAEKDAVRYAIERWWTDNVPLGGGVLRADLQAVVEGVEGVEAVVVSSPQTDLAADPAIWWQPLLVSVL